MDYFVTRHSGAIHWFEQQFPNQGTYIPHLNNPEIIQPGDRVMGSLPIHLIARVCSRGATFFHLEVNVPAHLRGQELTAQMLNALGATLVEYFAMRPISDQAILQLAADRERHL